MALIEKTTRKIYTQSQNLDTWKRPECTRKCPSGQLRSSQNTCLPKCKKKSAEACVGRWDGPCYNDDNCYNKYFEWPCESGGMHGGMPGGMYGGMPPDIPPDMPFFDDGF